MGFRDILLIRSGIPMPQMTGASPVVMRGVDGFFRQMTDEPRDANFQLQLHRSSWFFKVYMNGVSTFSFRPLSSRQQGYFSMQSWHGCWYLNSCHGLHQTLIM